MRMLRSIVAVSTARMYLFFWIRGIILFLCCIQLRHTIPNRNRSLMSVMLVVYCCRFRPKIMPVPMIWYQAMSMRNIYISLLIMRLFGITKNKLLIGVCLMHTSLCLLGFSFSDIEAIEVSYICFFVGS